jgi:predicted RNA-binding Zn-ribbon protein involved in translation (DUF1610 family)
MLIIQTIKLIYARRWTKASAACSIYFSCDNPLLVQWLNVPVLNCMGGEFVMTEADPHEITFQCPNCGHELKQTIGRLRANEHMTCSSCGIGINIDASRLANATEEIQKAIDKIPPEISIKFFR